MRNTPTGRRAKPFGRAKPANAGENELDTASLVRQRLQARINKYQREALRRALRGQTAAADALLKSAERLKALQRNPTG